MQLECGCEIFEILNFSVAFCKKHLPIYQKTKDKFKFNNHWLPEDYFDLKKEFKQLVKKLDKLLDEKELTKFLAQKEPEEIEQESGLFNAGKVK